jgi:hypothetical protein
VRNRRQGAVEKGGEKNGEEGDWVEEGAIGRERGGTEGEGVDE